MQPENPLNFVLCNHNDDDFKCRMKRIGDTKRSATNFSNRRSFIDGHLNRNGWTLSIECNKPNCEGGGLHHTIEKAARCLLPKKSKINNYLKKVEWKKKQPSPRQQNKIWFQRIKVLIFNAIQELNLQPEVKDPIKAKICSKLDKFYVTEIYKSSNRPIELDSEDDDVSVFTLATFHFDRISTCFYFKDFATLKEKAWLNDTVVDSIIG